MDWQETKSFLSPCFPPQVREEMELLLPGELQEIRIRADRPCVFRTANRTAQLAWRPTLHQVEALAEALSEHSLYARGEEMRQGFITLRGGHRMGLCGRMTQGSEGRALKDVASLCIRIACQWPGSADSLLPLCLHIKRPQSLLIIGPPGSGKTTLLRDLARQLASGASAVQTAVVDERGEIAACVHGVPQLDVGESTDVLDRCPKAEAIPLLVRAMSPQLIITDELMGAADVNAVMDAMASGCAVIASVHGASLHEAAKRPALAAMMAQRLFRHYAVLTNTGCGQIAGIYDQAGVPLQRPS